MSIVARTGRRVIGAVLYGAELAGLVVSALRRTRVLAGRGREAYLSVLLRQLYFTAVQAVPVVGFLALLIGVVIISRIIGFAGHGNAFLTGQTLVWIVVRAIGPLLAAVILVARSGTAAATELAMMEVSGEVESLRRMGIDPAAYLVMPRVVGFALSAFVLTLVFEAVALMGGILVASFFWKIPFSGYGLAVVASLRLSDLFVSVGKGLLFGLGVAAVCCLEGLRVGDRRTEVPRAATRAVMGGLFLVFVVDGGVSLVYFLL